MTISGRTHARSYLGRADQDKVESAATTLTANAPLTRTDGTNSNVGLKLNFAHCCILPFGEK